MYEAQKALLRQQTQITNEQEKFNTALKQIMGETSENIQAMKGFIINQGQYIEQQKTQLLQLVSTLQQQAHDKRSEDRTSNMVGLAVSVLVMVLAGSVIWS